MEPLQERLRVLSGWWSRQVMAMRVGLLVTLGVLLGMVIAGGMLGGSSEGSSDVVAETQTPPLSATLTGTSTPTGTAATAAATSSATATAGPTDTPEPSPTPTGTSTPTGTPTPAPTIHTVEELVLLHGHPPGYDFAQIRIPKLDVVTPVGSSYVGGGKMDAPVGPATSFWYDLSAWDGYGGVPGEGKNAIFSGHVDTAAYLPYADATYFGLGVFSNLFLLTSGDRIFVDYNGETLEYQVVWQRQIVADSDEWGEIWSSDVSVDSITLYTCGGKFDVSSASYSDRLVLRAERV